MDNTPNQQPKLRLKNWVEINDNLRWTYNTNSQIKFKTSMLRSSLFNYSVHIPVNRTITLWITIKEYYLKITDFITEINNTEVDKKKIKI